MFSFRFAEPWVLNGIWLIFFIGVASYFVYKARLKTLQKAISPKLLPFLTSTVSTRRQKLKLVLKSLAFIFFLFALARPQSGQTQQKVKSQGIELVFVLDVSNSMMAEDVRPSRLDLAKGELIRFLDLGGGNKVGLVAFAGSAVVLSPLTTDKNALKMYLESMVPDAVSAQGSDFGTALNEAKDAFKRGGTEGDELSSVTKAILLVSDGEDLAGQGVKVADEIKKMGIHIFSLAVGTEKGGPIPIRDGNGTTRGYRKDREGKVILTQASGKSLKEIASIGGGSFYHMAIGSNVIQQLKTDLEKLEKSEFESAEMVDYNERFQIFLILGLLLAGLDFAIGEKKKAGRIWRGRFEVMK